MFNQVASPKTGNPPLLGILGGMGPLATVDLMRKIIERTPVHGDADHVPMLVANFPQIPSRLDAWDRHNDAPLAAMIAALRTLEAGGATMAVISCNTAHLWYDAMQAAIDIPILHIADAAVAALRQRTPRPRKVGILATIATVNGRLYHDRLEAAGFDALAPDENKQRTLVTAAIEAVKANKVGAARSLLLQAAQALIDEGADCLLLACTEIPIALEGTDDLERSLDATDTLAQACVAWWLENSRASATKVLRTA